MTGDTAATVKPPRRQSGTNPGHGGIVPNVSMRPCLRGTKAMVTSGHYLSSLAGWQILEAGGNAIDAGVAVGLATSIVESAFVGIGGVAPCLLYLADRDEVMAISGVGTAPKAATLDHFMTRRGGEITGIGATVVPAAMDAWLTALEQFGTMSFAEVAAPAIAMARDGFAMYPFFHRVLQSGIEANRKYPANAAIYLPNGQPPEIGDIFVQTDLARVLSYLADQEKTAALRGRQAGVQAARTAFYQGDVAAEIARYHRENDGLMTVEDMAGFRVEVEPPCRVSSFGMQVFSGGPYGQGPSFLQALKILENFDLAGFGHNSAQYVHVVTEAIKVVAADRDAYIGDPRFVDVPMEGLLSDAFGRTRAGDISMISAFADMPPPGRIAGGAWPTAADRAAGRKASVARTLAEVDPFGTSYFCVSDRHGNMFSATPSDGSNNALHGGIVPGLGFAPSSRGKSFWADPTHPSCVAPGKRPRLTNGPAFAFRDGELLAFGSPGTDVQLQAMLQTLFAVSIFGFDLQQAVELPRFASYSFPGSMAPHACLPGQLNIERGIGETVGGALSALGHKVEWWPDHEWLAGSMCVVRKNTRTGVVEGAADPRRTAYAIGS